MMRYSAFLCLLILWIHAEVRLIEASSGRIIGGVQAPKNSFGEYVMILDERKRESCGASLIQENLVLTAAHCLKGETPKTVLFAKGNIKYDWKKDVLKSADEIIRAKKLIMHPRYQKSDGNDIGLVLLNGTMSGPFAKLAKRNSKPAVGTVMKAIGFGVNNDYTITNTDTGEVEGLSPPRLYEVNLTLGEPGVAPCPLENTKPDSQLLILQQRVYKRKELCIFGDFFYTSSNMIGLGIKSACSGDSGGPLFHDGMQYGVAGRVLDVDVCSKDFLNPFTVYTKVSAHRKSFIEPLMRKYAKKQ